MVGNGRRRPPMAIALIEVKQGAYGKKARRAVAIGFETRLDAELEAERLAKLHETHGRNEKDGSWWYQEGDKQFRLIVK
jgi:hypothetical protein